MPRNDSDDAYVAGLYKLAFGLVLAAAVLVSYLHGRALSGRIERMENGMRLRVDEAVAGSVARGVRVGGALGPSVSIRAEDGRSEIVLRDRGGVRKITTSGPGGVTPGPDPGDRGGAGDGYPFPYPYRPGYVPDDPFRPGSAAPDRDRVE